eukprot:6427063-Alexandrium_andersonii.AAC.1
MACWLRVRGIRVGWCLLDGDMGGWAASAPLSYLRAAASAAELSPGAPLRHWLRMCARFGSWDFVFCVS